MDGIGLTRILEEAGCPRGEPDYEYESSRLADREWDLKCRFAALIKEGRQEEAWHMAEELARVKGKIVDLERLAEN